MITQFSQKTQGWFSIWVIGKSPSPPSCQAETPFAFPIEVCGSVDQLKAAKKGGRRHLLPLFSATPAPAERQSLGGSWFTIFLWYKIGSDFFNIWQVGSQCPPLVGPPRRGERRYSKVTPCAVNSKRSVSPPSSR
jgi:hypothetical protein